MRVFVTGATGFIGSALVKDLIAAGHKVIGVSRSHEKAPALAAAGAEVYRGSIDDPDSLKEGAARSDGVVHLAFNHEQMRSGDFPGAVATELRVVDALGGALAQTGKPLVAASGTLVLAGRRLGRPGTEEDAAPPGSRADAEIAVLGLAKHAVRASAVRIPPITHSKLDRHGFARVLIAIARETGIAGYPADGTNRWPAGHTLDVGRLFRLALEKAPAGTRWHAAGDEGIPIREIAASIGRHLGIPTASIPDDQLQAHFRFLAPLITLDNPVTTATTRRVLDWEPTHPGLLDDFDNGDYFTEPVD